jgi:hypothetical protein
MKKYSNGNVISMTDEESALHLQYRGSDPRKLSVGQLNALDHEKTSFPQLIRSNCLDCVCGDENEVAICGLTHCPFWPYRMGTNPFDKRNSTPEQQASLRRGGC